MKKDSSSKSDPKYILVLIIILVGFGYWKWQSSKRSGSGQPPVGVSDLSSQGENESQGEGDVEEEVASDTEEGPEVDSTRDVVLAKKLKAAPTVEDPTAIEGQKQKELIGNFQDETKTKIKLPENLNYIKLDLEQGITGIYGSDRKGKRQFSMMATRKPLSVNQLVQYLDSESGSLPHVRKGDFKLKSPTRNVPPPPGRGIASVQVISGASDKDRQVFAALVKRTDSKGSYLFIMKESKTFFKNNEGFLDALLNSFEAIK